MMILHLTHTATHVHLGMMIMKVKVHMAALVAIMMTTLMLLHNVVLAVVVILVVEMLLVRLMMNH
jgi:hypothetical protein